MLVIDWAQIGAAYRNRPVEWCIHAMCNNLPSKVCTQQIQKLGFKISAPYRKTVPHNVLLCSHFFDQGRFCCLCTCTDSFFQATFRAHTATANGGAYQSPPIARVWCTVSVLDLPIMTAPEAAFPEEAGFPPLLLVSAQLWLLIAC